MDHYNAVADKLTERYESVNFEKVYEKILKHFPKHHVQVLDVVRAALLVAILLGGCVSDMSSQGNGEFHEVNKRARYGFPCETDPAEPHGECNPLDQDCPEGEICYSVAEPGTGKAIYGCISASTPLACAELDKWSREGTCRQICELSTGRGCDPDGPTPYCRAVRGAKDEYGFGYCYGSCEP
ncbi:hypothetical protein FIV42_15780 [Persicimonas caeni]|uniref:Uncharacterized protein n=1 Tax=Persicimonas caeni TaxID=2292766 RepID=A0A4Y6PVJ8_PERCE|nr:hypothetical protein [Persicimonas caeni]QDG52149.1 hypothetical protein FIV42_15780 [Persicimonas caeni]QED33371.1 hypothetical protein FRD00_15775 [Persicimonas caeni]